LGLVLGGATANAVDRFRQGYVVDYIDVHRWPVFNLADMCIVVGIVAALFFVVPRADAARGGAAVPPGGDR
jgi:signal peptidase II